uniref:Uncharacterized protein n=2 Tax=viral metagenome TaxID=1070528 RepID=A0A6H1ZL29_9ZZZZ
MMDVTLSEFVGFPIEVVDTPLDHLRIKHLCGDKKFVFPRYMPYCNGVDLPPGFKSIDANSAELVECLFCGKKFKEKYIPEF